MYIACTTDRADANAAGDRGGDGPISAEGERLRKVAADVGDLVERIADMHVVLPFTLQHKVSAVDLSTRELFCRNRL
jgi:hypothetical protein